MNPMLSGMVVAVLAAFALIAFSPARASAMCGDINGDLAIRSNDILMAARAVMGTYALTSPQKSRADVALSGGTDGLVLSNDLLLIIRASLDTNIKLTCLDSTAPPPPPD